MYTAVRRGRSNRSTWAIWSLAALTTLLPLTFSLYATQISPVSEVVGSIAFLMVAPVYGITGALIVSRQRRNSIGWMLTVIALGITFGIVSSLVIPTHAPTSVGIPLALTLIAASLSWLFFIFPIFHLLLTFPTGELLSRRWRWLLGLEIAMVSFLLLIGTFAERIESPDERWTVANPIGFIPGSLFASFFVAWSSGLLILTVAGLVAVVIRFRRSSGVERQQLKWLLFAVCLFAVVYGTGAFADAAQESAWIDVLLPVSMIGIGIAIAIALLRYRLFEIDRIISRTVSYTLVIGCLAAGVALVAAVVGTRFESPVVVAATTLGMAAAFNPLRRRVQKLVDRRFNRSRFDAERIMDEFTGTLRDRVDVDGILAGWGSVVAETMQPSLAGIWVRE